MPAKTEVSIHRLAYNLQQAARASTLSVRKLADAIRSGQLRSLKKGRRRIILVQDLEAYLCAGDPELRKMTDGNAEEG